jgi:flagellar biogenesis protein FliO
MKTAHPPGRDIASLYVRWTFTRAALSRGYWLAASLYLVEAGLSPFQLLFIGVAQSLTAITFEIPTGVMADTLSRKWSVVIAHVVTGAGMLATGFTTAFPLLVATQMLWGLGWTFSSGADVAWLTDELDAPARTDRVLIRGAWSEQIGAVCGLLALGGLAWVGDTGTAVVTSGALMVTLGVVVGFAFPERRFVRTESHRWSQSRAILRSGMSVARRDRVILLVLAATVLVNGANEGFGRLYALRLVELGLPGKLEPIAWLTGLGLATLGVTTLLLRLLEPQIQKSQVPRRVYAASCAVGVCGLTAVSVASDPIVAMLCVVAINGFVWNVVRAVTMVWVNKRTTSDVRATVQSFVSQAEYAGEIVLGLGLALVAVAAGTAGAIAGSAVLLAVAGIVISRAGESPAPPAGSEASTAAS